MKINKIIYTDKKVTVGSVTFLLQVRQEKCMEKYIMKNKLIKYRSVVVIATSLIFNLVSSLLVWHPDGQKFNTTPLTVSEWICDIVSIVWFLFGMMMMFFDLHQNQKEKIKEAIFEAKEELEKDECSLEIDNLKEK